MNPDKLIKLQELLKTVNDGLSKEEFVSAFKAVVAQIKSLEAEMIKLIGTRLSKADTDFNGMVAQMKEMRAQFEQTIEETKKSNSNTFAQIKQRSMESIDAMFRKMDVQGKMDAMYAEHEAMMRECEAKMPDTEKMMKEMEKEMLTKMPPETPELIRDKLETLEGNERLDVKAIKNLKEELEKLKKELTERITSIPRGGSRVSRNNIYHTLIPDGSTKIFSVPKNTGGIVIGSDFPTVLMEGAGFTVNAARNQITLTVDNAPSLNSQLVFIGNGIFNTI